MQEVNVLKSRFTVKNVCSCHSGNPIAKDADRAWLLSDLYREILCLGERNGMRNCQFFNPNTHKSIISTVIRLKASRRIAVYWTTKLLWLFVIEKFYANLYNIVFMLELIPSKKKKKINFLFLSHMWLLKCFASCQL